MPPTIRKLASLVTAARPGWPLWIVTALVALLLAVTVHFNGVVEALATWGVAAALVGSGTYFLRHRRVAGEPAQPSPITDRSSIAETLLATIPDPVIVVDRRVIVIEANPAARVLLPTLKVRYPLSFALRAPDVLDGIEEVLRTGQSLRINYAPRVPTERLFEVQIGALPMPDRVDGGPPNVVLFLRDLTSAQRLETMRVDFVANASHELRTPLSSLLGFIETLQGPARNDDAAREKFLSIMATQARRMSRLIDDLLSLSRIELSEHVPPTEKVSLTELAAQFVDAQADLAHERGVTLRFEEPAHPLLVLGDFDELTRVLENLVENALKYGGSGGLVEIRLARHEGPNGRQPQIELSVRDEGPGIAAEHLPRLTERFYRVDTASSRQQGGTGLGLAIVKHALNRHRGRIIIESELERGTTVRVILPEHREADRSSDAGREA